MRKKAAVAVLVGAWIGLLLLPLNVRVTKLGQDEARLETHLGRSLWIAAGVAAAGIAMLLLARARLSGLGQGLKRRVEVASGAARGWLSASSGRRAGAIALPLVLALALPLSNNPYYLSVGTQAAIYVGLALGLNIVVGQAGLLVLGYAAFYAVGAYSYGILSTQWHLPFWLGLPIGALLAALFGLGLGAPTLRLRGDYLAIVTLGFGEMMRIVLITADRLTGGPNGISNIEAPSFFGPSPSSHLPGWLNDAAAFYWLTLGLVVVTTVLSDRLNRSRLGRAWMAMREDETAARAMGINITWIRLLAFMLSACWAGLCGVFFAAKQTFISPESFTFVESVSVLAMVILGGMGSIPGVIAGAVILSLLPEVLRGVAEYRMIALSGLMIVMMIFRPQGLFPNLRRTLELKDEGERP